MMEEPEITINGTVLTVGQAMTVRVAVSNFAASLDEHGGAMTQAYQARVSEIISLMSIAEANRRRG
jgi:hypothetical protein